MKLYKLLFAAALLSVTSLAQAERGDSILDVSAGMGLNNDLPVSANLGLHLGFNEFTDIAFSAGIENDGDENTIDLGVGSFYTHVIGDVSPQYGLSLGPRLHMIDDENTKGFYLKAHFRALYDMSSSYQLYCEYSPEVEFGDMSGGAHRISVGFRFK